MPKREEEPIDLRRVIDFAPLEDALSSSDVEIPRPREGAQLLRAPLPNEHTIFPIDWAGDDFGKLSFFAYQYQLSARTLVKNWLDEHGHAENVAYAIAYLYRHAIELEMKAVISQREPFVGQEPEKQRQLLQTHSLHSLWNRVKDALAESVDMATLAAVEPLIMQLHLLDGRSDGFRYPFTFRQDGAREAALGDDLSYTSLDNLVYNFEAICNWLEGAIAEDEEHRSFVAEMSAEAYGDAF